MECDKTALTTNEKIMVMLIYNYFQKNKHYENTNLHKKVVLATGHHLLKEQQAEYINTICDLIFSANKSSTPFSIRILVLELSNLGFLVSHAQLKKCLGIAQQYWKGIEVEIDNQSNNDYNENLGASDLNLD
ncbi:31088_t:CDS:2 [Gigaspora margarita]|uniref:31088_t:CDS:1 n=1 Tax=Gigaspora margarita TaxID=4874 RepID=A0ABM8VY11_GIGMA|nr:31088_t:CDS:2 [Gigaspora margarita]